MSNWAELVAADCARSLGMHGAESIKALRDTTLIVTGGSGFVGAWIASFCAYLNDKHNFRIEVVLTARRQSRLASIAPHLMARTDIRFQQSDIRQLIDVPASASWVIHAAANPDSRFHAGNPLETMDVIAGGTYRVLRTLEQCRNLQMFLSLSSASIYGSQPASMADLPENHVGPVDPASVSSAYAEAKRFGETICAGARSQSRTPVVIARPFTFIGPFQSLDAPWAVNNFLHAALQGQPLKIFGNGENMRSYLYGSDAAFLLLRMLVNGQTGEVFNVGHPESISFSGLASRIIRQAGRPLEVRVNTARESSSAANLLPNMGRAQQRFGEIAAIDLEHAIQRALEWNRAQGAA